MHLSLIAHRIVNFIVMSLQDLRLSIPPFRNLFNATNDQLINGLITATNAISNRSIVKCLQTRELSLNSASKRRATFIRHLEAYETRKGEHNERRRSVERRVPTK